MPFLLKKIFCNYSNIRNSNSRDNNFPHQKSENDGEKAEAAKQNFKKEKMEEKDKTPEEKALERRLAGHLPTVDIDGQLFYVDLFMGYLRPKDIFSTLGIEFDKIQDDYSILEENFIFTYNPKTYEAETFDFNDIQSIPEDILLVELPAKQKLDPVSYARMCGYDVESFVRTRGIQSHFKVNTVPLKKRLLEIQAQQKKNHKNQQQNRTGRQKRKGRGRTR